jgi:hypothetical protein
MGGQAESEGWGFRDQDLRERPRERIVDQREPLNREFWEQRRRGAEWQPRMEREEPFERRMRAVEEQPEDEREFQRLRRGVPRGRTWVRRGEEEDQWEEQSEEELRGEARPARGAVDRRGEDRSGEENREGRRRDFDRRREEEIRDWEPKGRNELRAIRQNDRDRRKRIQDPDEEESEERDYRRKESVGGRKYPGAEGNKLESRIEAIEKDRRYEKSRSGLSTELRRLQSGVSAFGHPGLYSHIDKMVTLHEAPVLHTGPMAVAGATGDILKVPHIKLSYLADFVWEFTRRKCAERGEHQTDMQVLEIESQVMEYFGKQRVEAGKILDKAGLTGRGR